MISFMNQTDVAPPQTQQWSELAQNGEWKRALVIAEGSGQHHIAGILSSAAALQQDIRDGHWAAAIRALHAFHSRLSEPNPAIDLAETRLLESLLPKTELEQALKTLESAGRFREKDTLQNHLASLTHPLVQAERLNVLGIFQALTGQQEAARALFEQALQADPQHHRALINLGNLYLEANQFTEAEQSYRQALTLAPEAESAHHNLGVALRKQGKLGESVRSIRRASQLGRKQARHETGEEFREKIRTRPALRLSIWLVSGLLFFGCVWLIWQRMNT